MLDEKSIIFEVISGSHSYGLNTPESDIDYRGIFVPTLDTFISPFANNTMQYTFTEPDRQVFNIYKFFELAADANPNILELLFVNAEFVVKSSPAGEILCRNRDLFLSAKCKHTYSGYANSQLNRIKRHKQWLLNPITVKPTRSDYKLDDNKAPLTSTEFGAFDSLINNGAQFDKNVMQVFTAERQYRNAMSAYKQYKDWEKNRNPKRAELERKFGYDTKHATHLVRLLIQGREILTKGTLTVKVNDNDFVWAVKNGKVKFDELIEWADKQDKEMDDIYNNKKYVIRTKPNRREIEKVYLEVLDYSL